MRKLRALLIVLMAANCFAQLKKPSNASNFPGNISDSMTISLAFRQETAIALDLIESSRFTQNGLTNKDALTKALIRLESKIKTMGDVSLWVAVGHYGVSWVTDSAIAHGVHNEPRKMDTAQCSLSIRDILRSRHSPGEVRDCEFYAPIPKESTSPISAPNFVEPEDRSTDSMELSVVFASAAREAIISLKTDTEIAQVARLTVMVRTNGERRVVTALQLAHDGKYLPPDHRRACLEAVELSIYNQFAPRDWPPCFVDAQPPY